MAERLAAFRGTVRAQADGAADGLTLTGMTTAHPQDFTTLQFAGAVAARLPQALEEARVDHLGGSRYRIVSGGQEWELSARAVHLHRDAARQFYAALPPRPVPPGRRLFWRAVLALAGSRAGLSILRTLRR